VEEVEMKRVLWIGGGIVGVLVLGVVVLMVLGHRANAGQVHASTEIRASRERVWAWLEDGDKLKQWISWLVEVRADPTQGPGVGAKRVLVMRDENNGGQLMEVQSTCAEYSPPAHIVLKLSSMGAFEGDQTYELVDLGNGRTRLLVNSRYHFTLWLANLMEPLITRLAQKKMDGDVAHLKSLLETVAQ